MKQTFAIELISNIIDSNDLLLNGIDGIENASHELSTLKYYNNISTDNLVSNVFGCGIDKKFFYTLLSFKDNIIVRHESGFGYCYKKDDQFLFCRYLPVYNGKDITNKKVISDTNIKFNCSSETVNILVSSTPEEYIYHFYTKNCIISSFDKFLPHTIEVNENSFLGRINNNDLDSVRFDSSEFSNVIIEALTKYTNQLKLKCSKLAIKQLQLENNNGHGAKAGTFIYDKETDVVKFYNGTKWRILKWADEEKAE